MSRNIFDVSKTILDTRGHIGYNCSMSNKKFNIFLLIQLSIFVTVPYAVYEGANWLLIFALYVLFKGVGVSFYMHRGLTHKMYTVPNWIYSATAFIGSLQPPAVWAAVHAEHHKYADTEKDPHSPTHLGWKMLFSIFHKPYLCKRTFIELNRIPCVGFFTKYYFHLVGLIALVFVLFPSQMAMYWAVPVALNLWVQNISAWYGHRHGRPSPQPWFWHLVVDPGEKDHIAHHRYDNDSSRNS